MIYFNNKQVIGIHFNNIDIPNVFLNQNTKFSSNPTKWKYGLKWLYRYIWKYIKK